MSDKKEYFTKDGRKIVGWNGRGNPITEAFRSDREIESEQRQLEKRLDDFKPKSGNDDGNHFLIGNKTPTNLEQFGVDIDLKLTIPTSKLRDAMKPEGRENGRNCHGIKMYEMKNLVNYIKNPDYILKSKDGIIVVTNKLDHKGDPIILPIVLNGVSHFNKTQHKANVIKTVYGRRNFNEWIKKQEILWKNK